MNFPSSTAPAPILVALGSEARTLHLVHAAFRLAREQGRPWVAVHVEVLGWETPEEADQARVWLQEAQELGAETAWVRAPSVVNGLLAEARKRTPETLLMGHSRSRGPLGRLAFTKGQEWLRRNLGLHLVTLSLDGTEPRRKGARSLEEILGVAVACMVLTGVCTIFAAALNQVSGFAFVLPVYAAGVAFVAHRFGLQFAIPDGLLVLLSYDFFLAEPVYSLRVRDWTHMASLAGILAVVLLLVDLVRKLALETRSGRRREAETVLLMLLGRTLARCGTLQELADVLVKRCQSLLQVQAALLVRGEDGNWMSLPEDEPPLPGPEPETLLSLFGSDAVRHDPLEPVFLEGSSFLALASPQGTDGILQIHRPDGTPFPQATWGLLQAFVVQGTMAFERIRWVETARMAHLESETERMRSALLSSVSHDLRTPLAAIQGAASSLLLPAEPLPESTRRDLLAMIHDESKRLAFLIGNLLDLTRLESGAISVRKEWQPLDEVVGAALRRVELTCGFLNVRLDIPEDLPLVPLDAVLIEQLLINLLMNARRHAPDSPIDLQARIQESDLELVVSDQGPGIPEADRERVFNKFFRLHPGDKGGLGLGLAICEAIAKVHGGRIWVEAQEGGGARFRVRLPLEGTPPSLPDAEPPTHPLSEENPAWPCP